MTEKEQYNQLLILKDKLLFFNEFNEVTLEQSDLDILKDLYKVYFENFKYLNVTCSSCVKDMLNVCISRYSALKQQFDIAETPKKKKKP